MSTTPTILIVDDEEIIRTILAKLIRTLGYQSLQAANSDEALELVDSHQPDLVLLDIIIPGSASIDVLKAIKQNQALTNTSIIMISGTDNLSTMAEFIKAGADDFLLKPFNATLFKARVAHALERSQHQHAMNRLQNSLSECRIKLQQSEDCREEFCKSLSHDINNALTAILMTAELLLIGAESDQQRKNLADIINSAEQIPTMIKQRRQSIS